MDYVQPCRRCGSPVTHWRGNPAGRAFEPDPYEPYRPHLCAAREDRDAYIPEYVPGSRALLRALPAPVAAPQRQPDPQSQPAVSRGAVARGLVRLEQVGPYARPERAGGVTTAPPVTRPRSTFDA